MCKLSIAEGSFSSFMRWRDPKLVVGTDKGVIHIWQNVRSTFTVLGRWVAGKGEIFNVDFNEDCVMVEPLREPEPVNVHYFNGHLLRSISSPAGIIQAALHENSLITCKRRGGLEIWDIFTGNRLKELKGNANDVFGFGTHSGLIASRKRGPWLTIWKTETAVQGSQGELASLPHHRIKCLPSDKAIVSQVRFGPNFLIATSLDSEHERKVFVTDFLS